MDGTARAARRAHWQVVGLAVAAAGLLAGCGVAEAPIEVAAATARVWPAEIVAPAVPDTGQRTETGRMAPPAVTPGQTIELPLVEIPDTLDSPVLPPPPFGVSPATTPMPAPCGGFSSPRRVVPGVVVGRGQATLDWQAGGRASVLSYRVTAVSQRLVSGEQPIPPQVVAAPPGGCQTLAVTFTGLTPGVPYVFWMEEETYDLSRNVTQFIQVGSTNGVVIG